VTARRSAAQALVWLTLSVPLFVSTAGLAIDGGVLLTSRRELQSLADGWCWPWPGRPGRARPRRSTPATSLSSSTTRGRCPCPPRAAARAYLDNRLGPELTWQSAPDSQIEVSSRRVSVLVQTSVPTAFLRVVHIDAVPLAASAFADIEFGIRDGGGG